MTANDSPCTHKHTVPLSRDRSRCVRCGMEWAGVLIRTNGVHVASVGRP